MARTNPAGNPGVLVSPEQSENLPASAPHPAGRRPSKAGGKRDDYFVEKDGLSYAGTHLLIDLWGAKGLDDAEVVATALKRSVAACDATLLNLHLHRFSDSGGISGVAVIAESHISIHTWPERGYAAIDIFMCGARDPYRAIPELRRSFVPSNILDYTLFPNALGFTRESHPQMNPQFKRVVRLYRLCTVVGWAGERPRASWAWPGA